MGQVVGERPITRIVKLYMHPPFMKELDKRQRETRLIDALEDCIDKLQKDPTLPGLHLEQIDRCGGRRILSARINAGDRLIVADLRPNEVGLLYFGDHDESYRWVDRNRDGIVGMLGWIQRMPPGGSLRAPLSFPRVDADAPIAVPNVDAIRTMLARGMTAYLAHLDGDQTYLAQAPIAERKGLTLVKGGAGTGKTALAVARVAYLARSPEMGHGRVLYLCYNRVLAETVGQILDGQFGGRYPRQEIEVARIIQWSQHYLHQRDRLPPIRPIGRGMEHWLESRVRAILEAHPELKERCGGLTMQDIANEVRHVLRPNGFASEEDYLRVERRRMRVQLKQPQRSAVWSVASLLPEVSGDQVELEDLPGVALAALAEDGAFTPYRAVVVDEAQDFTPVMIRLARSLLGGDDRRLFVLADTGQSIYPSGFYWAQRELRARGGQVTYLRTAYRTTREIDALARSLYGEEIDDDLRRDIGETHPPLRSGPRPELAVHISADDEAEWLAAAILSDLAGAEGEDSRQPEQIAVLAPSHAVLERIGAAFVRAAVPIPSRGRSGYSMDATQPSVKLATIHAAKGLDFPAVYLAGLTTSDLFDHEGWADLRALLYVGMTRSSHRLVLSTIESTVHPLLMRLPEDGYRLVGDAAQRFASRR